MSRDGQKPYIVEGTSGPDDGVYELQNTSKHGGTAADEHDMRMLGRTQVLNVRGTSRHGKSSDR